MKIRKASWWRRTLSIIIPKKIVIVEELLDYEFLPWGGGKDRTNYRVGDYLNVPMKSGKRAICRVYEVDCPLNPGDLYFYSYEFIRYIREGEHKTF